MTDQWIVRVQNREYGPVGVEELLEWKREGRLIRENEVREANSERWFPAGELPEIFGDELSQANEAATATGSLLVRRLSFGEILAASWQIYRRGFGKLFVLALLVVIPTYFFQLAAPFLELPKPGESMAPATVSAVVVFVMLVLLIIGWPFSVGATQLLAADLLSGKDPTLGELFARAKPLWTRILGLGLVVYGSYLLWTIIPLWLALQLVEGQPSPGSLLLALCLLIFTAYMVARLFINFLFWQQAAALGNAESMEALRESKDLARSGTDLPRLKRPLYRGALIASLWLVVVFVRKVAIELPVVAWKMRGVTSFEQGLTKIQSMANSFDLLTCLTTLVSSLVHAALQPLVVAIFVVLYLDTKRTWHRPPND